MSQVGEVKKRMNNLVRQMRWMDRNGKGGGQTQRVKEEEINGESDNNTDLVSV